MSSTHIEPSMKGLSQVSRTQLIYLDLERNKNKKKFT